ncbi:MAG: YidC/Oxa1 family membrane protein insertase [Microgenomates group bacterium]
MLNFLTNPINQLLIFLYGLTGQNLGFAIILLTLIIRGVLVPVTIPSLKSAKKLQELKPHLDRLKEKHKDKQKLQLAQLELYKQHGINPASGCLPQIAQLLVLIALYQVFIKFINVPELNGQALNLNFFWLNLGKPDPYYILPVLAGLSQLVFSLMMTSGLEGHLKAPKKKDEKKKEEDSLEMAQSMSQQMLLIMPAMTVLISLKFPSGLALYWVITTVFSLIQQYLVSGPGGLKLTLAKIARFLPGKLNPK